MAGENDLEDTDSRKLSGLLQFAAGILSARGKTRLRVDTEKLAHFRESDLLGTPGLSIPTTRQQLAEDVWLRLERLRSTSPPLPDIDGDLYPWINKDTVKTPNSNPEFEKYRVSETTAAEANELLSTGVLKLEGLTILRKNDDSDQEEDSLEAKDIDLTNLPSGTAVKITLKLADNPPLLTRLEQWRNTDWAEWVEKEKPIRKSVSFYKKLFKLHTVLHSGDSSANELVWGVGMAEHGKPGSSKRMDIPLIEFLLDIELKDNGTLVLMPRDVPPYLNLRPLMEAELDGAAHAQPILQREFKRLKDSDDVELTPFTVDDWDRYFEAVTGQISSDAEYIDREQIENSFSGSKVPDRVPEILRITGTWVIYCRPRSSNYRVEDLNELDKKLGILEASGLPEPLSGFVQALPDEYTLPISDSAHPKNQVSDDWGDYVVHKNESARPRYFFPLASNEDQNQIIEQLDVSPVVTVTGPPGTGKTHSIANIVAHYMASGKRVLVTARTAEAIAAVQSKLPPELAALVIASVSSDREGAQQLESAIQRLSDEVVHLKESDLQMGIETTEVAIAAAEKDIIKCDIQLARISQKNLTPLTWRGEEVTVMALADKLEQLRESYFWFEDKPNGPVPMHVEVALEKVVNIFQRNRDVLNYTFLELPSASDLPKTKELIDYHQAYIAEANEPVEDYAGEPKMAVDTPDALERAVELERKLEDADLKFSKQANWFCSLFSAMLSDFLALPKPVADAANNQLPNVGLVIAELTKMTRGLTPPDVRIAYEEVDYAALVRTIESRLTGRGGSLSSKLLNRKINRVLDEVTIDGELVGDRSSWQSVLSWIEIDRRSHDIRRIWDPLASTGALPEVPNTTHELSDEIAWLVDRYEKARVLVPKVASWADEISSFFPYGIDCELHIARLEFKRLARAIRANLVSEERENPIEALFDSYREEGKEGQLFSGHSHQMLELLHDQQAQPNDIIALRNELTIELDRVLAVRPELEELKQQFTILAESGAPHFAERLREFCVGGLSSSSENQGDEFNEKCLAADEDTRKVLTRVEWQDHWKEAWEWASSACELQAVLSLGNGDEWRERKQQSIRDRESRFLSLIQAKTRLGLKSRITPKIQSEFMNFTQALGKLGAGTGKAAFRHRKTIKAAARKASPAIPVWIMPESKVSEQLPADLGSFDLVILDEASQSDVTSVGVLARGAKLLIVGDEKQVSPSSVGVTVDRVDQLRAEHLQDLPNKNSYDEKTSIFDIAMLRYPQSHLTLREHFRCVHPIIEFSTRFYDGRLIPLRVAKASERFDPPLVDVHIKGAMRNGKLNEAEANYIVEEIASLTSDPAHIHRDIGVISLLGAEQAEHIERLLMDDLRIGPEVMERHHIICGDSRTMQGQERSVVFLSMVADSASARVQRSRADEQRFNVAMSRARDREYLVRSVASHDLKTTDLKLELIQHFYEPLPEGRSVVGQDVLSKCESGFEKDVCQKLLDAGYRVRSQVAAGYYRIDLVVEGDNDSRLAVELDGDHWHGPEQWEKDMIRQTALERAGWNFWRVFGSQWYNNEKYYWDLLIETLAANGIEPIGGEAIEGAFTEFRVVDVGELNQFNAGESLIFEDLHRDTVGTYKKGDIVDSTATTISSVPI